MQTDKCVVGSLALERSVERERLWILARHPFVRFFARTDPFVCDLVGLQCFPGLDRISLSCEHEPADAAPDEPGSPGSGCCATQMRVPR